MLDQFYKFLGPELKAVTGESQGIDDVMLRVQGLIGPLEKVRGPWYHTRCPSVCLGGLLWRGVDWASYPNLSVCLCAGAVRHLRPPLP